MNKLRLLRLLSGVFVVAIFLIGFQNFESYPACFEIQVAAGGDIQAAISSAEQATCSGRKIVKLAAVTYDLATCIDGSHLKISGSDITLSGADAALNQPVTTLKFSEFGCDGISVVSPAANVKIENVNIDYAKKPFTQGLIRQVAFDANRNVPYVDVAIDTANYPLPTQAGLFSGPGKANMIWGYSAKKAQYYTYQVLSACTDAQVCKDTGQYVVYDLGLINNERRFRFYENKFANFKNNFDTFKKLTGFANNTNFVLVGRYFKSPLSFVRVKGFIVSNVSILMSPGTTAHLFGNEAGTGDYSQLTFSNYNIVLREGTDIISSVADGIHSLGNYAPVLVQYSSFNGNSDDAIALNLRGGIVSSFKDNKLVLASAQNAFFKTGDTVDVINISTAELRCRLAVTQAVQLGTNWELNVAPNTCTGVVDTVDKAFNENMALPKSIIKYNTFGKFRGGMRILTSVHVFHNDFYNGGAYRIIVGASLGKEGYTTTSLPQNVFITRNNFFGADPATDPMRSIETSEISVYLNGLENTGRGIKNLQILGNTFNDVPNVSVNLRNCSGCIVKDNTFAASKGYRQQTGPHVAAYSNTALTLGAENAPLNFADQNTGLYKTDCAVRIKDTQDLLAPAVLSGYIGSETPQVCLD